MAFLWLFAEPSIRSGESLSWARRRVFVDILHDPLLYFFVIAMLYAGARLINTNLALAYDVEKTSWSVVTPSLSILPAGTAATGYPAFAAIVGTAVCVLGLLNGVGLAGRLYFSLAASFFAGCGGLVAVCMFCLTPEGPFAAMAARGFDLLPSWAPLYGVWLIVAVAAGTFAEVRQWKAARLVFSLALAGNFAGLFFFSPPLVAAGYLAGALSVMLFGFFILSHTGSAGFVVRNIVFLALGFGGCVLLMMVFAPETYASLKLAALDPAVAVSEAYQKTSEVLSRTARSMWMEHPWQGVGLGAFPLHLPFVAEKADWLVIPPDVTTAQNGWWTFLAERGILGCVLLALCFVLLLFTYIRRFVLAFLKVRKDPESEKLLYACPPVVWIPFLIVALVFTEAVFFPVFQIQTILPTVAVPLALAAASFPRATGKG